MTKNYRNRYTGQQVQAHFFVKGAISKIDALLNEAGLEWKLYSNSNEYEFTQKDEYGFTSTAYICLGDYVVWDGEFVRLFTPQRFADVFQIIPVNGTPEILTGQEEPEEEPERNAEGFRKWVGHSQHPSKTNIKTAKIPFPKIFGKQVADKSDWYSEEPWWPKLGDNWKHEQELLENDSCLNGTCDSCNGPAMKRPETNRNQITLDAYRITEDFDEWDFAEWLTPGDKFTLTNNVALNASSTPVFSNPAVRIYNPKTEGNARVGDLVIRVAPHRYTIQACVPDTKEVD